MLIIIMFSSGQDWSSWVSRIWRFSSVRLIGVAHPSIYSHINSFFTYLHGKNQRIKKDGTKTSDFKRKESQLNSQLITSFNSVFSVFFTFFISNYHRKTIKVETKSVQVSGIKIFMTCFQLSIKGMNSCLLSFVFFF